jgi:hypothetical protein
LQEGFLEQPFVPPIFQFIAQIQAISSSAVPPLKNLCLTYKPKNYFSCPCAPTGLIILSHVCSERELIIRGKTWRPNRTTRHFLSLSKENFQKLTHELHHTICLYKNLKILKGFSQNFLTRFKITSVKTLQLWLKLDKGGGRFVERPAFFSGDICGLLINIYWAETFSGKTLRET